MGSATIGTCRDFEHAETTSFKRCGDWILYVAKSTARYKLHANTLYASPPTIIRGYKLVYRPPGMTMLYKMAVQVELWLHVLDENVVSWCEALL